MPFAVTDTLPPPVPLEPPRKRWTRAECDALEASGLLNTHRLELIEGDLIDKTGKKRPHSNALSFVLRWTVGAFGFPHVQTEVSIDIAPGDNPSNEPEPDLIVLSRPAETFRSANPQPEDLRLVVEVSDSTLRFDRSVKARLYARAGILEYWIVDVKGRLLIVHRDPHHGEYTSVIAYAEHESVAPLAAPASLCCVKDLLPPE